ncbi:MAG: hydrogenase maturation protease [Sedimentisphaerales bacterium]|nr:hydrogenase maturation protease [Sedimentisphaerales bacterium]
MRTESPSLEAVKQQLRNRLSNIRPERIVILGMGHELRGDDGVGPMICRTLNKQIRTHVIDVGTTPENYIQRIVRLEPQVLLIIDAADNDNPPGTAQLWNPDHLADISTGTHCPSPRLFVDLIRRQISLDCIFLTIQPAHIELGSALSKSVNVTARKLIHFLNVLLG